MSPLDSPSSSSSPAPLGRKRRSFARRCERRCCIVASYFPLAFIYSLTSWAAYVEAGLGFSSLSGTTRSWTARPTSILGICLYILLNLSYTIAVFTDPGSPSSPRSSSRKDYKGYSHLPTIEPSSQHSVAQPITVSSTGAPRYCKKCSHAKPDRTHHCSTCRRCVLKMDHHCPWLATCVGLHNYKAFILFLVYTSLFCWVCFGSTAYWVWAQVLSEQRYLENLTPVNVILLAVISGIIGLVLTGFTGWHLYLCARGMTTIECLEKTRYLRGVRTRVERQRIEALHHPYNPNEPHGVQQRLQRAGEAVLEFHANAVPGATRLEEGEERASPTITPPNPVMPPPPNPSYRPSPAAPTPAANMSMTPAQSSLARTYASHEAERERARYEDYLADQASAKLPHAFDLGWRRNLAHLFGPKWYLWPLPATNTTGDGWRWELSPNWLHAVEEQAEHRRRRRHHHHDSDALAPTPLSATTTTTTTTITTSGGSSTGLRGGGAAATGTPDLNHASSSYQYDPRPSSREGAMSLQTLKRPARSQQQQQQQQQTKQKGKGKESRWRKRRRRRDLDYGGEGAGKGEGPEVGFFEVSSCTSSSGGSGSEGEENGEEGRSGKGERLHGGDYGWRDWEYRM